MFRMQRTESSRRYYRALAKLTDRSSPEYRQAMAGLAAVNIDEGQPDEAHNAVREAMRSGALSTREAPLHLLRAQALWQQGRHEEARAACAEYEFMTAPRKDK